MKSPVLNVAMMVTGNVLLIFHIFTFITYSPFYKNLPKSSLQMHWISVRFYELGYTICIFYVFHGRKYVVVYIIVYLKYDYESQQHMGEGQLHYESQQLVMLPAMPPMVLRYELKLLLLYFSSYCYCLSLHVLCK